MESILVRDLQRSRTDKIYREIYIRDLLWKLGHAIMEAKKSHNMPSAQVEKPGKPVVCNSGQSEGLKTRGADGVTPSLGFEGWY